MRLYPPAWLIARSVEAEGETLSGHPVRKGSMVFFSPFVSHRNPAYFPDPERFDPDRFTPEAVKARPRYAYFPFAGGPRQCIGDAFARMEAKIALAVLLSTVRPGPRSRSPHRPVALGDPASDPRGHDAGVCSQVAVVSPGSTARGNGSTARGEVNRAAPGSAAHRVLRVRPVFCARRLGDL